MVNNEAEGMSLCLYLSNTGRRLQVDLKSVSSPDALRSWIAEHGKIPAERQILMTAKGKNVRQQHILSENEIFVYDKTYLAGASKNDDEAYRETRLDDVQDFPSTLTDENSLPAWQELFMTRRAWALEVTDLVKTGVAAIEDALEQAEVLQRCTGVALENLQNHSTSLQQSAERTFSWAHESLTEQTDILQEWRESADTLSELPVREDIARLLRTMDFANPDVGTSGTMLGMLHNQNLEEAARTLGLTSQDFQTTLEQLRTLVEKVSRETENVMKLGQLEWPDFPIDGLLPESEALAKQVNKDYQEVLLAHDDPKSISLVSRRAVPHTQNILPTLLEIAREIHTMLEKAYEVRGDLDTRCRQALKQISAIQSQFGGLHSQISALKIEDDGQASMETLDKIFRLPVVYGSTLIEATRRSEWNDKMRTEFESLRDEITQHKDDEIRRRKKWAATLSGFVVDGTTFSEALIDLNFSTPANKWPYVSREEVFAYIEDLRALGINEAVQQVTQLLKELDNVVKLRRPKQNAFKNGSVFDLGQSMIRNGDQVRSLQDDKLRLEDKLRASDSRIRKLEDLLHRQSQLSRAPSGMFTPTSELERQAFVASPNVNKAANVDSRRSSLSLRRLSNQTLDDKAMVQRIVSLEAQITKLQEEAQAERQASVETRDKMNEAEAVKRDLMANFEAQRQEFEDERQLFEDDNHKLKLRLEEVEDELDRMLGSRDHQRLTQDQTISILRMELDKVRKTADQELEELRTAKENTQHELHMHRDRALTLERQSHQQREDKSHLQSQTVALANQLREKEDQSQDFLISLQSVHSNLSPTGSPPDDIKRLVAALEILSEGAAIHIRGLDDTLQLATAEKKSQQDRIATLEAQVLTLTGSLENANNRASTLQEHLNQERSKAAVAQSELADEQLELRKLRDKFAAGETGSDALKARLIEEERRVTELTELNGKIEAQSQSLKHEINTLKDKVEETTKAKDVLHRQYENRGQRAKDLSERLFQHNDRIIRMLESFGYSITRQDDTLTVQRASKVNASTTLSVDGATAMKRTASGSIPVPHYVEPADLDTLYWTNDDDAKMENDKYKLFIKAITRLDLDSTIETVTKRYKDVETLAKKYQKDSRGYRERSHRLQSEAHDKIAYRSFKEGDLALFLPTRNQATRPWAAFNVGAPHYFLREHDTHRLPSRDWLLARISKIEERVVDLSRSLTTNATRNTDGSDGGSMRSVDDENPFELSDGLRWYLIDASEEKPGAPSTPGLGKSTVAASVVDVKGHMGRKSTSGKEPGNGSSGPLNVTKTLHKSLDSRRSSETSREAGRKNDGFVPGLKPQGSGGSGIQAAANAAVAGVGTGTTGEADGQIASPIGPGPSVRPSDQDTRASVQGQPRESTKMFDIGESGAVVASTTATPAATTTTSGVMNRPRLVARQSSGTTENSGRRSQIVMQQPHQQLPALSSSAANTATTATAQSERQRSPTRPRPWDRLFNLEYNG